MPKEHFKRLVFGSSTAFRTGVASRASWHVTAPTLGSGGISRAPVGLCVHVIVGCVAKETFISSIICIRPLLFSFYVLNYYEQSLYKMTYSIRRSKNNIIGLRSENGKLRACLQKLLSLSPLPWNFMIYDLAIEICQDCPFPFFGSCSILSLFVLWRPD